MNTKPEIKTMKVADLKPAPYNPREISREALDGLKKSLRRFGLVEPVVWNVRTGFVVGGHQRLKGMVEEGIEETLVVVVDLDENAEKALNTTLNNPHIQGNFTPKVQSILEDIQTATPDFADLKLDKLLSSLTKKPEVIEEDDIPPAPEKPETVRGDVWLLGSHRLMCGDATEEMDWERLMAGKSAHMVFTDPPYGVEYKAPCGKYKTMKGDENDSKQLIQLVIFPALKNVCKYSIDVAGIYIWHSPRMRDEVSLAMKKAGIQEKEYLIWAKPYEYKSGWNHYRETFEPCFYAAKEGQKPEFYRYRAETAAWRVGLQKSKDAAGIVLGGGLMITNENGDEIYVAPRKPRNKKVRTIMLKKDQKIEMGLDESSAVIEIPRETERVHATQKPVELARRAIVNSSKSGQIVVDPFLGSGTTLLGAEKANRLCYGMELDEKNCDVIVGRWEALTGKKASKQNIKKGE